MKPIKTFVFDMDGTLLDSMGAWQRVDFEIIQDLGIPSNEVNFNKIITYGLSRLLEGFRQEWNVVISEEEFIDRSYSKMNKWYEKEARILPGVGNALKEIREMGCPIIVATATPREMAKIGLKSTGLWEMIDLLYSTSEDGLSKNEPGYFQRLEEKSASSSEEMVLFDDALYSLVTARACGWYTVGIRDRSYPQDWEKIKCQADEAMDGFSHFYPRKWLSERRNRLRAENAMAGTLR